MKLSLALAGLALFLVDAPACSSDDAGVMRLDIQREDGVCYSTVDQTLDQVRPGVLPVADACKGPPATTSIVSGSDRVRVVVDYGVPLDDGAALPTTALHVYFDGVEATVGATEGQSGSGDHRGKTFTFLVPAERVNARLSVAVSTTEGYTTRLDSNVAIIAPTIGAPAAQCSPMPCTFAAGLGVGTFWVDVLGTQPRSVVLVTRVNGIDQPLSTPVTTIPITDSPNSTRAVFTNVTVPTALPDSLWDVIARVDGNDSGPSTFTLAGPAVSSPVAECASPPCLIAAGVGPVGFDVAVDGTDSREVLLVTQIAGVEQPPLGPQQANRVQDGKVHTVFTVPVPVVAPGTVWDVIGSVAGVRSAPTSILLGAPTVTASLTSCPSPCSIPGGSTIPLTIAGPMDLEVKQGLVSVLVDGASAVSAAITLDTLDAPDSQYTTVYPVLLPATTKDSSILQIDVSVGGFHAKTILATVTTSPAP